MCLEKLPPFARMVAGTLAGVLLGIFFGLLCGLLIAWITQQVAGGSELFNEAEAYGMPVFLGMGFGAVIGAILGSQAVKKS